MQEAGKKPNPFIVSGGVDPTDFVDRKEEVGRLFGFFQTRGNAAVCGGRRTGKTSLLYYVSSEDILLRHSMPVDLYIPVYIDCQSLAPFSPQRFWRRLAEELLRTENVLLARFRNDIQGLPERDPLGAGDFEFVVDHLGTDGAALVLVADEFDIAFEEAESAHPFLDSLRALLSRQSQGIVMVTATHRALADLCGELPRREVSAFESLLPNVPLGVFDRENVTELVTKYLDSTGVAFSDDHVGLLMELAGRHPYLVQAAGHVLYDLVGAGLGMEVVARESANRFESLAGAHFEDLWNECDEGEQTILMLLALKASEGVFAGETYDLSGLDSLLEASPTQMSQLDGRGMIVSRDGNPYVFSRAFEAWLLKRKIASGEYEDIRARVRLAPGMTQERAKWLRNAWEALRKHRKLLEKLGGYILRSWTQG